MAINLYTLIHTFEVKYGTWLFLARRTRNDNGHEDKISIISLKFRKGYFRDNHPDNRRGNPCAIYIFILFC